MAKAFGVTRKFGPPVKRATFVIGPDSRILKVVSSELRMSKHADEALIVLKNLS